MTTLKTLILLLAIFASANIIYAQSSESTYKPIQSVGINLNPNVLIPGNKLPELNEVDNTINYSIGAVYAKQFNPRIRLVTGFQYSLISYSQKDYSPLWGTDHNGAGGANILNSWKIDSNKSHYIGVPLELNYILSQSENALFAKVGFELMINVANDLESTHYVGGIRSENSTPLNLNNNNLGKIQAGFGYEIKPKSSFHLILEPEFEYYVYKIYNDLPLYSNSLVSFGLNAKVMFGL